MKTVPHPTRKPAAYLGDTRRPPTLHMFVTAAVTTGLAVSAHAQQQRAQRPVSLASFVPDNVVLYAEFDKLDRLEGEVSGADAWNVIRRFVSESSGGDWRELLNDYLTPGAHSAIGALWRTRFAVAVEDWDALDQAIVVVERPEGLTTPNTLNLFAGEAIIRQWRKGSVPLVESRNGLVVAAGERVVVLSPAASTGSLMDRVVNQLNGRRFSALSRLGAFRVQVRGLPRPRDALVYWRTDSAPPDDIDAEADFLPLFRSGVLGLSLAGATIEVVARDAAPPPEQFVYTPRVRAAPIERLPQSTLAAWASTIDPRSLWSSLEQDPPHQIGVRIFERVKARVDTDELRDKVLDRLGPRIITVLGCDFASDQRRPFVGVLIECVEPQQVAEALAKLILSYPDAGQRGEPVLKAHEHLGSMIYQSPLSEKGRARPDSLAQLLVSDLRPSFASMDGWFIISSSPVHVTQILDAARGMSPSIGDVVDLASQRRRLERSISGVVIQPAFAVSTLRFWNELFDSPVVPPPDEMLRRALGIEIDPNGAAGCVMVSDVNSSGPSADLIRAGDAIVAADGAAFDLEGAADHLSRLIRQRANPDLVTIRILRNGAFLDATVNLDNDDHQWTPEPEIEGLFELLSPIEDIASRLNLAVYASINPPRTARSAELALQLAPASSVPTRSADAEKPTSGDDHPKTDREPD